jgi:uncharacterized protein (TIGR01777 family)
MACRLERTGGDALKIAVTGASGLVGQALVRKWDGIHHSIVAIGRRPSTPGRALAVGGPAQVIAWDPAAGALDPQALAGVDAVVHLAGESLAAGRWDAALKERLRASRVLGTQLMARAMAARPVRPRVLVCASAIGYYGDRGDEILTEDSARGVGFLPDTCQAWEAAANPARDAGIRVVHVRIGIVLSRAGGALVKMLPPFRMGVGGPLGSGRQWMSWISLADLVHVFDRALQDDTLEGAINAVAPTPVTNAVFSRALAAALHRPALFRVPTPVLRLILGAEKTDALLLSSTRVMPARLQAAGHPFQHEDVAAALREILQ